MLIILTIIFEMKPDRACIASDLELAASEASLQIRAASVPPSPPTSSFLPQTDFHSSAATTLTWSMFPAPMRPASGFRHRLCLSEPPEGLSRHGGLTLPGTLSSVQRPDFGSVDEEVRNV